MSRVWGASGLPAMTRGRREGARAILLCNLIRSGIYVGILDWRPSRVGLMPVTYTQFLTLIASALRDENGLDLAYLIRPVSSHSKDLIKEFRNPTVRRGSLQPVPLKMRRPFTAPVSVSVRRRNRVTLGRNSNSICLGHYTRCKTALCRRV